MARLRTKMLKNWVEHLALRRDAPFPSQTAENARQRAIVVKAIKESWRTRLSSTRIPNNVVPLFPSS